MLPDWYHQHEVVAAGASRGRAGLAVRRALARLGEAVAREVAGAPPPGSPLARMEPRAKVIAFGALIFGASALHGLLPLAAMFAAIGVLALVSRLPVRRLARAWLGVPLFSLAIILPATVSLITPGPELFSLWHFAPGTRIGPWTLPHSIAVTGPGVFVAARFLLRTTDCVMLAFLLAATSDPAALVSGLRRLGMPRAFGMVLATMQRYLALLLRAAQEIHLAKLSRTIAAGGLRGEQRWVAAGIGSLFRRTRALAEQVHEAMLARGWDGEACPPRRVNISPGARLRMTDALWLAGALAFTVMLLAADRLV